MTKAKKNLMIALVLAAIAIAAAVGFILYRSTPSSVSICTSIDKTQYNYGDTLDTTGLSLVVTYNSGRVEVVTDGIVCSPMELTMSGTVEITANYRGMTTTFSVESIPVLTGIRVTMPPENTRYVTNSTLDFTGLTLEASYNDGRTETISDGFTCSPENLTQTGTTDITVTYQDQSATFSVEVAEVSKLAVRKNSARNIYLVGETPDPTGAVLDVTYSDGATAVVREGYTCSGEAFTEPGSGEYTFFYGGAEAVYAVEVLPAVEFDDFTARCTGIYDDQGFGKNANGEVLTWMMYMQLEFPEEAMDKIIPVITCSWTEDIKDTLSWDDIFPAVKAGNTALEFVPFPAEYTSSGKHMLVIELYLPDDPTIAGEQFLTIRIGASELTVYFTLEYMGDYETGTGWYARNIRY